MNPEPTITMTASELAKFVDDRIAADREKREAESRPAVEPPTPNQNASRLLDPAFEAVLLATFDAEGGNVSKAAARIWDNIHSTRPDEGLLRLYDAWRTNDGGGEWVSGPAAFSLIGAYMQRADQKRKTPPISELVANFPGRQGG